jgi:type II secretory pathway component PulF
MSLLTSFFEKLSRHDYNLPPGVTLRVKLASMLFASDRPDYYRYLSDMIMSTEGKVSLKELFQRDVERRKGKLRGYLAAHWDKQFNTFGGKLKQTFEGTLPTEDVEMLNVLQRDGGNGALQTGLNDLAQNAEIVAKARGIIFTSSFAGAVCLVLLGLCVFGVPYYIVPTIKDSFSMVPPENYPASAITLFGFSNFVENYWFLLMVAITTLFVLGYWSFSNLAGPVRLVLDKYGVVWGMHRDFQALRFISSLASMTKRRGTVVIGLKEALLNQMAGASRWKRYHVSKMLSMVRVGNASSDMFATGILDKDMYYFLDDLIESRGFDDALQYVRTRMEDKLIRRISLQSLVLNWVMLLLAIAGMAKLSFLSYQTMDEMRLALQMVAQ